MEPPIAPQLAAGDSVNSSPRSRATDSFEDSFNLAPKLRLMCSFGGHIVPRPHDKSLCYIGGDTRIIVVDRQSSLAELNHRLSKTVLNNSLNFSIKYQIPNEDLDSLISVTTDEDLDNMIDEYDRLSNSSGAGKSSRLRLFVFPAKSESVSSINSLLEKSGKSEEWFLNALNGSNNGENASESNSVNCLLGLDDIVEVNKYNNIQNHNNYDTNVNYHDNLSKVSGNFGNKSNQDVLPDLETTSSFGSASSSPSLVNLPPIRLHVAEDQRKVVGIEEQFGQMSVGGNVPAAVVAGDYSIRILSDEERSDQGGVLMGYRKQVAQQQAQVVASSLQQKQTGGGGFDLASPDSVASDGGVTNPLSRQKPMIYNQDPNVQIQLGQSRGFANSEQKAADSNSRVQMQQQFQDSGYVMPAQYDPQQHPQLQPQQPQLQQQQPQLQQQQPQLQQQLPQQQQQQQQHPQFIQAGGQYIRQHPAGAVPMGSYYQMYPSQQSHYPQYPAMDNQYPVYYVPARQPQAYNMPVQQQGYSEAALTSQSSGPQTPPAAAAAYNGTRNAPVPNSEMSAGVYRTETTSAPFFQVSTNQQQPQYAGFQQIHHPSQSNAPTSAANANYAYQLADPTQTQMYYTQPMAPQYQNATSILPESAPPLSTDSSKQQARTLQP